ncbi:MAG TPA: TIGR03000 domain-containing protein [Gemmataceae bacterium]|nr:TIGR03000 domain-containing protein [Gemmataceae bacterium]
MRRNLTLALAGLAGLYLTALWAAQEPVKAQPVRLKVMVPANAEVEIEGAKTKQTGPVRRFISPPVEVGKTYVYSIKATWTQDGKPVTVERTVRVKPGEEVEVDLTREETARDSDKKFREPDVIFVPTPQEVVEKMLELAKVTKDDVVYDLGCGDGRIVVTAAKKYGCKAVGFDIDPERVKESLENVKKNNVEKLVEIKQADIFTLDLSPASVVTLYLLPELNVKLIPQLEKLKPGSRIVSHDFDMRGVKPDQTITITPAGSEREHTIYLWTTPLKKE